MARVLPDLTLAFPTATPVVPLAPALLVVVRRPPPNPTSLRPPTARRPVPPASPQPPAPPAIDPLDPTNADGMTRTIPDLNASEWRETGSGLRIWDVIEGEGEPVTGTQSVERALMLLSLVGRGGCDGSA